MHIASNGHSWVPCHLSAPARPRLFGSVLNSPGVPASGAAKRRGYFSLVSQLLRHTTQAVRARREPTVA
eukprot:15483000-Alexandrium_andersonii.AAC.1